MNEEDLQILEANRIWEEDKKIIADVSRAISAKYAGFSKDQRQAIMEAGRAGFVHGYLKGKSDQK